MNWEIIAATGEWAGALAVVFSFLYLARQIHQQNKIARYQAWQNIFDGFNTVNLTGLGNSTLFELLIKGTSHPDQLTEAELLQLQISLRAYYNNTLKAYRAYQLGFLEEADWAQMATAFRQFFDTPAGQRFRDSQEGFFDDFWVAIDAAVSPNTRMDLYLNKGNADQEQQGNRAV